MESRNPGKISVEGTSMKCCALDAQPTPVPFFYVVLPFFDVITIIVITLNQVL